jgi:hypothetical protein
MATVEENEKILRLLEIHTTFIRNFDGWIKQTRYVYVLALGGLIAHFYSNGSEFNVKWYFLGTLFISSLCYFSEAPIQYWQGGHFNLAHGLYDRLKKDLKLKGNPFPFKKRAGETEFASRVLWTIFDMPATTLFYSTFIIISSFFLFGILKIKTESFCIFTSFWIIPLLLLVWNFLTLSKGLFRRKFNNSILYRILG